MSATFYAFCVANMNERKQMKRTDNHKGAIEVHVYFMYNKGNTRIIKVL